MIDSIARKVAQKYLSAAAKSPWGLTPADVKKKKITLRDLQPEDQKAGARYIRKAYYYAGRYLLDNLAGKVPEDVFQKWWDSTVGREGYNNYTLQSAWNDRSTRFPTKEHMIYQYLKDTLPARVQKAVERHGGDTPKLREQAARILAQMEDPEILAWVGQGGWRLLSTFDYSKLVESVRSLPSSLDSAQSLQGLVKALK